MLIDCIDFVAQLLLIQLDLTIYRYLWNTQRIDIIFTHLSRNEGKLFESNSVGQIS